MENKYKKWLGKAHLKKVFGFLIFEEYAQLL